MYYEEKIIDGVLCWRTSPDREFTPYSPQQLTERIEQYQAAIQRAFETLGKVNY